MSGEQAFNVPGSGPAPQGQPPPPPAATYSTYQPGQLPLQQMQQQQQQQQQHLQLPLYPPNFLPDMKLTRGTSCVLCQQRKVRCDKNKPCANCVKAGAECRVVPPQPPRRRKKRMQEKDLLDRLRKYEALLHQHGIKFDAIDSDLKTESQGGDEVDELENDFEALKTSPDNADATSKGLHNSGSTAAWLALHREFRASEKLLHDSSEEEPDGSSIHRAFDKMYSNSDGFPFIIGGVSTHVSEYHPSTIHILQFWQIYIDNVNPLLKLTHVPSIQGKIIEATSHLEQAPKSIEALMFSIYLMALTSLDDEEVQRRFNESKHELLGRYFVAAQQALLNANFMRIPEFLTLQAYLLYLHSIRWFVDPRQVYCLTGIAVRMAQKMGLHRDPGTQTLPPLEIEQRRRLWWNLVAFDRRIGEMTGSTVTALSSGCDCKMPLNVNDSDLHVDGKEPPPVHNGPTEMLFSLSRIELSMTVASNNNHDAVKINPERGSPSSSHSKKANVTTTIRLAGQDIPPYTLEGFCAHIEGKYLSQCDPKIPLHLLTLTMTRQALCKMRVINFLIRDFHSRNSQLKEVERDSLFQGAIEMLEYDSIVQSTESLRQFRWYAVYHFPFPAYMFLVQELRLRTSGPLVERAWAAIEANYEYRGILSNLHSPMHTIFSSLFVKAWTAHQEAQLSLGKEISMPYFITILRDRVEKRRKARLENRLDPTLEQLPVKFPRSRENNAQSTSPEANVMMTPPVDPSMGLRTSAALPPSSTASGEDMDMDWSYLIAGYQDTGVYQGFNNFNTFPSAMPPMGGSGVQSLFGPGGPGGGGFMYGN